MYLVDGRRYEQDEHGLECALATAYDDRIRPLCLCCNPAIPVYITRLGGAFVLKRMPFTGSRHAVGCTHYEPPAELSGLVEVLGTAISEDPDTGVTRLRVGFSLSKGAPKTIVSGTRQDRGSVRSDGTRLSLRGLLHFMWREAELTKWRPAFDGKRTWAVVRSHLLAAASNKVLKGMSLADALYIPEAFTASASEAIRTRRDRRFAQGLKRDGHGRSKMILVGEVKEIVPTRFHFSVVVKHVPDMPFLLSTELHRRMTRHFANELVLWSGSAETHLIIAATFALTDWGQPAIDEICLILTSAHWIPADDGFEKLLIDRLVRERRTFDKALGFNSELPPGSISAVLLDAISAPVPLALDRGLAENHIARSDADSNENSWQWNVHQAEMPVLPRQYPHP